MLRSCAQNGGHVAPAAQDTDDADGTLVGVVDDQKANDRPEPIGPGNEVATAMTEGRLASEPFKRILERPADSFCRSHTVGADDVVINLMQVARRRVSDDVLRHVGLPRRPPLPDLGHYLTAVTQLPGVSLAGTDLDLLIELGNHRVTLALAAFEVFDGRADQVARGSKAAGSDPLTNEGVEVVREADRERRRIAHGLIVPRVAVVCSLPVATQLLEAQTNRIRPGRSA